MDEFGNKVKEGDFVLFPSPAGIGISRRKLVKGEVVKVFPKSVEVDILGGDGVHYRCQAISFVKVP